MNMQSLMAQAQKMQKDIMNKKSEVDKKIFPGKSELVDVEVNGKKEVVSVNIKNKENITVDDLEILQDMIMIAINDANNKVDEELNSVMGPYGNSLNGLL
ncbi:MAG: YbaB/EbfC family nucleoid-associated protein [Bacilli bacterium]|nr:YbaB/EbfC family nucleoid-associated protein [Bacilli bacterium]